MLIESGLRITDACRLPFDPIIDSSVGWPCLRYHYQTMRAEQLNPLGARAAETVRDQQAHVRARWPAGSACLFPRHHANPDATHRGRNQRAQTGGGLAARHPPARRGWPESAVDPASLPPHLSRECSRSMDIEVEYYGIGS